MTPNALATALRQPALRNCRANPSRTVSNVCYEVEQAR